MHKPIETKDKDVEILKKESYDVIYSVLPDYTKELIGETNKKRE